MGNKSSVKVVEEVHSLYTTGRQAGRQAGRRRQHGRQRAQCIRTQAKASAHAPHGLRATEGEEEEAAAVREGRQKAGWLTGELGLGKEKTTATTPGLNLEAAFPGNKAALLRLKLQQRQPHRSRRRRPSNSGSTTAVCSFLGAKGDGRPRYIRPSSSQSVEFKL